MNKENSLHKEVIQELMTDKIMEIIDHWRKLLFLPGSCVCCVSKSPDLENRSGIQVIDVYLFKRSVNHLKDCIKETMGKYFDSI